MTRGEHQVLLDMVRRAFYRLRAEVALLATGLELLEALAGDGFDEAVDAARAEGRLCRHNDLP